MENRDGKLMLRNLYFSRCICFHLLDLIKFLCFAKLKQIEVFIKYEKYQISIILDCVDMMPANFENGEKCDG